MGTMGRKRKNDDGMEPRVYHKHGQFYYAHRNGKWEALGKDKDIANRKGRHYNDPENIFGTLVYWLDQFLIDCEARVESKKMSARTVIDYKSAIVGTENKPGALRLFFAAPLAPQDLTPQMVQDFLEVNEQLGRGQRGNKEKAALSSCISWLIRTGRVPGLVINPCMRASGVKKNPGTARDRYVTHAEYSEVFALATPNVKLLMQLTYRTLQRPESDIILWDRGHLISSSDGAELQFIQNKTGKKMKISLDEDLIQLLKKRSSNKVVYLKEPLIQKSDGKAYTYSGLTSMLLRYIKKANEARASQGIPPMPSFGFRDLKGKGATDMWLEGTPIETIQHLCGHSNKSTTEIYVKQRWKEAVDTNKVKISNGVARGV